MGKRKGGKKNTKINSGDSWNSPSGKVEAGPSQRQRTSGKKVSMKNLPPEVLTEILKCVDTPSLFKCRLVNRKWSEISSGILSNRRDAQNSFEFTDTSEFVKLGDQNLERGKRTLWDFLKCMKTSKNCPYSHFAFSITNRWSSVLSTFFDLKYFKEFLTDFSSSSSSSPNKRIKGLELSFFCLEDLNTIKILGEKLEDVLLNKIPRLEHFSFNIVHLDVETQFQLFPNSKEAQTQKDAIPVQFQLPHLKSIGFEAAMISTHSQFTKDLFNAAVNLKKVQVTTETFQDFNFLHSVGKLHLVKEAKIYINKVFFSALQIQQQEQQQQQQRSIFPPLPQLQILDLRLDLNNMDQNIHAFAAHFLANLFESCKNTLKTFKLQSWSCGFACLPGFQLPTFKNLKELRVSVDHGAKHQVFPAGSGSKDIFPAVVSLDLCRFPLRDDVQLKESLPVFPSLKTCCIKDVECTENAIPILALICPNLKNLRVQKTGEYPVILFNFSKVGRAIWTHMKQLESLEVDVNLNEIENNPTALDSCFTGISIENCQRLYKWKTSKGKKFQSKNDESKDELMTKREHPSILDMTNLKTLKINPYSGEKLLKRMDFFTRLTWISEKFAFKFLPHLKPKLNPDPAEVKVNLLQSYA